MWAEHEVVADIVIVSYSGYIMNAILKNSFINRFPFRYKDVM